jgi:hypothetical protein
MEAAWAQCSVEANRVRRALATRALGPDTHLSAVEGALPVFLGTLTDQCRELPGSELTSLDRVLERKLYDIDRADIQAVIDGSEDGFLYARGFIVAMGSPVATGSPGFVRRVRPPGRAVGEQVACGRERDRLAARRRPRHPLAGAARSHEHADLRRGG